MISISQLSHLTQFYSNSSFYSPISPGLASLNFLISPNLFITLVTSFKNSLLGDFAGGAVVKNLPANARDTGSSPGLGRSKGHGANEPVRHNY